jgi:hypothetical protein
MKQRIYIDTSVIGGCEDEEFSKYCPSLPDTNVENVFLTEEAELVAQNYIDDGVVTAKHIMQ